MEGYQKSNLKGEGLRELHYGVLVKDIGPKYESVELRVLDVKNEKPKSAEFPLPKLEAGGNPINSRASFEEGETFPPQGWELTVTLKNQQKKTKEYPPAKAVLANLEAFADAAAGRAPYPVPQEQMIANISALEAVFKSAKSGQIEKVTP